MLYNVRDSKQTYYIENKCVSHKLKQKPTGT